MTTYEAVFNSENKGVYGISLVENPAMEGNFIALSKDKEIKFKTINEEQRILMGLVLEPNKPIYRNQDGEEFNIVFSEQTIKDLSHNFFKQGYQHNSTIEHDETIEGVTFVESWLVEDSKVDKSANFGFSYPKGSWIATMKVDSDDVWNEYVKSGKVLGFSVDAFVTLKEVKLNKDKSMIKEVKEAITDAFTAFKAEMSTTKIELGSIKTADGAVDILFEGDMMAVGGAVWVEQDGERISIPVGEYELESGMVLIVSEEGVIGELKEPTSEATEEASAEMNEESTSSVAKEISEQIKSVLIKYSEDLDAKFEKFKAELSTDMEALKNENSELKKEVVELSEQPVEKPKKVVLNTTPRTAKGRLTNFLNSK